MSSVKVDDAVGFLEGYGIDLHDTSDADEKKVICPFHDDTTPSCGVNIEKQVFKCPSCDTKGDLIDLVAGHMKVRRPTILEHVKKLAISDESESINGGLITAWHNILKQDSAALTLLMNRKGVNAASINRFLLGKDKDRYTIPIPDSQGKYVNVRKWSPTDKKRKVINLKGHGKRYLFPMSALEKDTVIITEGEFKAILLQQMGFNAMSPTGGASTWSPSWDYLFEKKVVYLIYDVDDAGRRGAQRVARSLFRKAKQIFIVNLPIDKNEYPKGDITDFVCQLNMGASDIQACLDAAEEWKPDPLNTKIEDDGKIYDVTLAESSKAMHYHRIVKTQAVVSSKDMAPYIVPKVVEVKCTKDRDFCTACPILNQPADVVQLTIDEKHPGILTLIGTKAEFIGHNIKAFAGIPRKCDVCRFDIKETQNVEELRLIPEIKASADASATETHVVRRAYFVGHGLETNVSYEFLARVVPEPSTQYATLLAYEAKPAVDSLTTFKLTEERAAELHFFKPKEWTLNGIKSKLDEVYDDLEANVTRIYQRRELHIFYDLIYHSVLRMPFQGKVVRGWMEGVVLGDSGQGKSETVSNMMRHYGLGEKIDSKGATVAGIMGGLQETGKRWFVSWGVIPLNDRKLVVLEEVKGMATGVIEKLTDMRSSGVAELSKIEKARTNARTRQIWISNPRSDQQLGAYNFGIYAVKELIGALEDIRRFDMGIIVASGDVPTDVLNVRDDKRPKADHRHTGEFCRDLILWAWSRTPDQIVFDTDATEAILVYAEQMGKKYVSTIPLVEAADQRLKLARMAAALACRTFSCVEGNPEVVRVRKCHAEYVHNFLDRIYSMPTFGYAEYSNLIRGENSMSDVVKVEGLIESLPNTKDAVRSLLNWSGFSVMDWMDVTEHDKDEAREAMGVLVRCNAIKRGRGGLYFKTPSFIALLRSMEATGKLGNEDRAAQINKKEEF